MKITPSHWTEIKADEKQITQGQVHVMCSQIASVYHTSEGVETLIGTGTSHKITFQEEGTVHLEWQGKAGRAFIERKPDRYKVEIEEEFTNIDRMPHESGTMQEIKKGLRQIKLERQRFQNELRNARRVHINKEEEELTTPPPKPPSKPKNEEKPVEQGEPSEEETPKAETS